MSRYSRQEQIEGWDQKTLEKASIVMIGAGALGNHVAMGLIGLGIKEIKIIDFDDIEPHNLNRQVLFLENDIGENKAESLAKRIEERNSEIIVTPITEKVDDDNIDMIIGEPDIIIDCVDLIYVRRMLSVYCLEMDIPLVHGGISWNGWQAAVLTRKTPCINCLYPKSVQDREKEEETSCIAKPQSSVVYTGQMCGSFMVNLVRKILMPLESDKNWEGIIFKYDEGMEEPFFQERMERKKECEDCLDILEDEDPELYEKAIKEIEDREKGMDDELENFLE